MPSPGMEPVQVLSLSNDWREELRNSLETIESLVERGILRADVAAGLDPEIRRSVLRIPPYYLNLIGPEANDPIRAQAVPDPSESDPELPYWAQELSHKIYGKPVPWTADAIGDQARLAAPRLTHRYGNRALLHVSSSCSMYCRFCFRKSHLTEHEEDLYGGSFTPALDYLREHAEIQELVLSGGDPLALNDAMLERLLGELEKVESLKVVRIHTRMPATLPYRLNLSLMNLLARTRAYRVQVVTHFNHPRELTRESLSVLERLGRMGVSLLNQSVLLHGVNDSSDNLAALFQRLYLAGVIPYYLHHPDLTPNTFRFRVSVGRGREIIDELRGKLSGPALPDYILDGPRGEGKISLLDRRVKLLDYRNDTRARLGAEVYALPGRDARLYLNFFGASPNQE
jgi:lysine 2,3-aminomutase